MFLVLLKQLDLLTLWTSNYSRSIFYSIRFLTSLVGKAPVYRAGGLGSIPGRTKTQGLKIIEKALPLL